MHICRNRWISDIFDCVDGNPELVRLIDTFSARPLSLLAISTLVASTCTKRRLEKP